MRAELLKRGDIPIEERYWNKAVKTRREVQKSLEAEDEIAHTAQAVKRVRKRRFRGATAEEKQNIAIALVLDAMVPGDLLDEDVVRIRALVQTAWQLQDELRRRLCPQWACRPSRGMRAAKGPSGDSTVKRADRSSSTIE